MPPCNDFRANLPQCSLFRFVLQIVRGTQCLPIVTILVNNTKQQRFKNHAKVTKFYLTLATC